MKTVKLVRELIRTASKGQMNTDQTEDQKVKRIE